MGAYDAQADTTHGLAVLLYETMTTTSLPGGGTAVNKSVRIEPLRGYLLRNGDTLTLHRRSGGEIPLEDCILFKPDKKNGKH